MAAKAHAIKATKAGTDQAKAAAEATNLRAKLGTAGASLKAVIADASSRYNSMAKVLNDNESRMTTHGFVTSDNRNSNGTPKYPNCNSNKHDDPAGNWSKFRSNFAAIKKGLSDITGAVDCHMLEMGVTPSK